MINFYSLIVCYSKYNTVLFRPASRRNDLSRVTRHSLRDTLQASLCLIILVLSFPHISQAENMDSSDEDALFTIVLDKKKKKKKKRRW